MASGPGIFIRRAREASRRGRLGRPLPKRHGRKGPPGSTHHPPASAKPRGPVTEPATELLVVDGTYELYRAFYGAPRKATASGQEVGGALGIARSLHALARTTRASHLAVAFDTVIESFRNGL